MQDNVPIYPFCAVVGQSTAKMALLLHVVHPKLAGVLLCGEAGTAKSTLVRGLVELLPDKTTIAIPLHITEDRLLGGIDVAHAVQHGTHKLSAGLLHEADGNAALIDDVQRMPESRLHVILQAAEDGFYEVEREGVSARLHSRFLLFGTMTPSDDRLLECDDSLLGNEYENWGLFVQMDIENDIGSRKEIIRRRLEFERDPYAFIRQYDSETAKLRSRIHQAQLLVSQIQPSEYILRLAGEWTQASFCAGHRSEIRLVETARAIAAWEGEKEIREEHIRKAARFVLPDGIPQLDTMDDDTDSAFPNPPTAQERQSQRQERQERQEQQEQQNQDSFERAEPPRQPNADTANGTRKNQQVNRKDEPRLNREVLEKAEEIGSTSAVPSLSLSRPKVSGKGRAGRRNKTEAGKGQGRYIRAEIPKGSIRDLAFDATVRAAAPYQKLRREQRNNAGKEVKTKLIIERNDIRTKVREQRRSTALWFVVDASGSMNASRRMRAVKGAVMGLLQDAYQKRDSVGLITFRGDHAEVLLEAARSVDKAGQQLRNIPTGGKTPLSAGLAKALEAALFNVHNPSKPSPFLVIVTDGRTNVCLVPGNDPWEESRRIARQINALGIPSLVIDTEQGFVRLGYARRLSAELQGQYVLLEQLEAETIQKAVKTSFRTTRTKRSG